jgi:hypothetical protein
LPKNVVDLHVAAVYYHARHGTLGGMLMGTGLGYRRSAAVPDERPWLDILRGIGRAFDPFPARRAGTFQTNDRSAFLSDLARLQFDKDLAQPGLLSRLGAEIAPVGNPTEATVKAEQKYEDAQAAFEFTAIQRNISD